MLVFVDYNMSKISLSTIIIIMLFFYFVFYSC